MSESMSESRSESKSESRSEPGRIRQATLRDILPIQKLVNGFAKQDLMLPVSIGDLHDRLRDFQVAEIGGAVVGCCALHVVWEGLVEVRSLAVDASAQHRGLGHRLVEACLEDARKLGAEEAFTLTYVPGFFESLGFRQVDRSTLPHKVWQDCTKCTRFPDCGELALTRPVNPV